MAGPTAVLGQLRLRPTVAFECVGVPGLIQQLIGGVPAGSRIVVTGINTGSDSFEPAQGILKELDIRFSLYYTPHEFAQTFAQVVVVVASQVEHVSITVVSGRVSSGNGSLTCRSLALWPMPRTCGTTPSWCPRR
jgi:D-arabinose 1-dehydrogenase-like Zn-dependent alcohol dehydrogenase